jgi:competence protein ComEA
LRDGDQVHVPSQSDSSPAASPSPNAPRLISLNTATQAELESLPEVGPSTAAAIIAYREAEGPFQTLEELMEVEGIGPATFEAVKPFITLED